MYLDISCANCGPFHHQGKRSLNRCPTCDTFQVVIVPHDFEIDNRFRAESGRTPEDAE